MAQLNAPVYTDTSGNILNTPLTFSNKVSMIPTASNANDIVSLKDLTNSVSAYPIPIGKGGTSTNTTLLVGTWTNTLSFSTLVNMTVGGTNNAGAYKVGGQLGFTGVVTNNGSGSTNLTSYFLGIVTNNVRTP